MPLFGQRHGGSVVCPSCGRLVGASEPRCPFCGRVRPGMFGMGQQLRQLEGVLSLWPLVGWVCGALYLATLATDPKGFSAGGAMDFFAPSPERLMAFGASGYLPVFEMGRWWTVLSASWLHGNLLHLGMNMYGLFQIAPAVERLYGTGRTWLLYIFAGVTGFLCSSVSPFLPRLLAMMLGSGGFTIGASASLFGMFGALVHASRRGGNRAAGQMVWTWALAMFIFGLLPGLNVDNWAHLGGFVGGWVLAHVLDPQREERIDHLVGAAVCLLASAGAVIWSLVSWR